MNISTENIFDVKGKKAIVTGSTRGWAMAWLKAYGSGAEVVIVGTSDRVFTVADDFKDRGFACHAVKVIWLSAMKFIVFSGSVAALGGDLDILVTSHGIQRRHSAEEFPMEEWDEVLNVNLNSVFILCQEAGKIMLKKGYGKIVTIASMSSFFGGQTVPAYAAAKGGIAQLTKELSNDWIGRGINVNSIAPGYMATEMNDALLDKNNPRYLQITERIPAHRWGTGDDMKGPCLFLCSMQVIILAGRLFRLMADIW